MESNLNSLIEKIKSEGVEEAQVKADEIISNAKDKAKDIIEDAKQEADSITKDAKKQADSFERNSKASIDQAARNTLLALRENIIKLFDSVLKREVKDSFDKDTLKELLKKAIDGFTKDKDLDLEVLLSDKDKKSLQDTLLNSLSKDMKAGVTLKASHSMETGFRIGQKGKDYFYDFSDDAIFEAFRPHLSHSLAETLDISKASKDAK